MSLVKICGITRLTDAKKVQELGAWAVGFILYPKSPRYIAPEKIREIVNQLNPQIEKVGVFVNEGAEWINQVSEQAGLTMTQLHGDESAETAGGVNLPVIKAFRLKSESDITEISQYSEMDYALVDAVPKQPDTWGGTGEKADWSLAAQISFRPWLLSGGLNANNLAEAFSSTRANGVDLSSSVEDEPGVKNHQSLCHVFDVIKSLG